VIVGLSRAGIEISQQKQAIVTRELCGKVQKLKKQGVRVSNRCRRKVSNSKVYVADREYGKIIGWIQVDNGDQVFKSWFCEAGNASIMPFAPSFEVAVVVVRLENKGVIDDCFSWLAPGLYETDQIA
jgi:hypothetical protein